MKIPRDIMKTASGFADEWHFPGWQCDELREGVAALLMAERQRCVEVVQAEIEEGRHFEVTTRIQQGKPARVNYVSESQP